MNHNTNNIKNWLLTLGIEAIVAFVVLLSYFYIESLSRVPQHFLLSPELFQVFLLRSLLVSLSFVVILRISKAGLLSLISLIPRPQPISYSTSTNPFSFLTTIYFSLTVIFLIYPIRPVLQEVDITGSSPHIENHFVKIDRNSGVSILGVLAFLTLLTIPTEKNKELRYFYIVSICLALAGFYYQASPVNYGARISESRAYWVTNDFQELYQNAQSALESAENIEQEALAYYWMGVAQNRMGNPHQAIKYQQLALETNPNNGTPHSSISLAYTKLLEIENAGNHARKCLELSPYYSWCHYALAAYQSMTLNHDAAIKSLQTAITLDPKQEEFPRTLIVEQKMNDAFNQLTKEQQDHFKGMSYQELQTLYSQQEKQSTD